MARKPLFYLVGRLEPIEPLGILHLIGLTEAHGWECEVELVKEDDFTGLFDMIVCDRPDLVGFSVWTGWHLPTFAAAGRVRNMGIPVVIGGPHATYFTDECCKYADWVVKGDGFRSLRLILEAVSGNRTLPPGTIHDGIASASPVLVQVGGTVFDTVRMAEGFPHPHRGRVYRKYPKLGASPIKSMMCSEGCPYTCSYCYAPTTNEMYGGFKFHPRPIDSIIAEALHIRNEYPLDLVYMQDDIFGYDIAWLKEFALRWPREVGVPFHCQIRLELTRDTREKNRLDLLAEAGCTGLTLAIEHGSAWMRRHILDRHMTIEDIQDGMEKIRQRGFRVRTEQIFGLPFDDLDSILETLEMNAAFPELTMFWASIFAPYLGTLGGTIAKTMGIYLRNNDDLSPNFFDDSVLSFTSGGRAPLENVLPGLDKIVRVLPRGKGQHRFSPFEFMRVDRTGDIGRVHFGFDRDFTDQSGTVSRCVHREEHVATLEYLGVAANERFRGQVRILQRLANFFVRVPEGPRLARTFAELPGSEHTWSSLGACVVDHLIQHGYQDRMEGWRRALAEELQVLPDSLPPGIAENPYYFCFFPAGGTLARKMMEEGVFALPTSREQFDRVQPLARRHLFAYALYEIEKGLVQIASR